MRTRTVSLDDRERCDGIPRSQGPLDWMDWLINEHSQLSKPHLTTHQYRPGFLSDERSYKGTHFAKIMAEEWGQQLHLLNLNGPSGKPEGACRLPFL